MKSRFLLVISVVLFVVSCSHFVNLGDKSDAAADNTEGLPDELYEGDNADAEGTGNYNDWNEDTVDSDYYDENAQDKHEENDEQNAPYPDEDYDYTDAEDPDPENSAPWEEPTDPAYVFPESSPFPEGFSNDDCNCGEDPQYDPICCNGVIVVFNSCFAHCYAIYSGNKICTAYYMGLCAGYENSDDDAGEMPENDTEENDQDNTIVEENDDDEELPDSDEDDLDSGCGCYPGKEAEIFSCGEHSYLITSCLANCLCEEPEKIF